jgi:RNA polymerase sigma-70 factor, ECF subfamily
MVNVEPDRLLIGEALAQLSAADRAVLRRSYYEGCTTGQIAHDLHIPEDTVKSRLQYAVRALQHALQKMGVANRSASPPA